MPIIASMYAIKTVCEKINTDWTTFMDAQSRMSAQEWMAGLHDYHAIVSGLKALFGWRGAEQLEQIRLSMGGHAYHQFNAIPGLIADYGVLTTGGGDNTPLAQQTARYLISSLQRVTQGKKIKGSVMYLARHTETLTSKAVSRATKAADFCDPSELHAMLTFLVTKLIAHAAQSLLEDTTQGGKTMAHAWNDNMMLLIACCNAHSALYAFETFSDAVSKTEDDVKSALTDLVVLFGLDYGVRSIDRLLEFGYLTPTQSSALRDAVRYL
jgi:acyl-CoA oxidase